MKNTGLHFTQVGAQLGGPNKIANTMTAILLSPFTICPLVCKFKKKSNLSQHYDLM